MKRATCVVFSIFLLTTLAHAQFAEICDGIDNNLDGEIDERHDNDGDGFYEYCGTLGDSVDCDDSEFHSNMLALDLCDGIDNDCDSDVDEDAVAGSADTFVISLCTGDSYYAQGAMQTTAGLYYDTLSIAGGTCIKVSDVQIVSFDLSVTNDQTTLSSAFTGPSYWIDCITDTVVAALTNTFTPLYTGDFAQIQNQHGCYDTSACETVTVISSAVTTPTAGYAISAYPIPIHGDLTVDFHGVEPIPIQLFIYNQLGQLILHKQMLSNNFNLPKKDAEQAAIIVVQYESGIRKTIKL